MKTLKKNIFKSVLFVCLGLTITTIVFASTRVPYNVPGRPGTPLFSDFWANGCDLFWTAPDSDGGSPITGYLVEVKDKYSPFWEKTFIVPGTQLTCTVQNMIEGNSAQFRVIASNKVGFGEPSEASPELTFKPRK